MAMRRQLARSSSRCAIMRSTSIRGASGPNGPGGRTRMPGGQSRWSAGKDLSWEPLRLERVCEVKYDHMQGDRFRHAAVFLRWRPDKRPRTVATISWRSRLRTSSRRSSARGAAVDVWPPPRRTAMSSRIRVGSCAGRSSSGTCCRLMRTRVHVVKRPRIESTSTSAACECDARFRMARLPALDAGEHLLLSSRPSDLDQRKLRTASLRRLHARGSPGCFL
jgi:hypothetical protein